MATYTHQLTEIEMMCGVTIEEVAEELPRGVFRDNGETFVVAGDLGPALAGSVARCAFAGAEVDYIGRTPLGRAYRPVD